METWQNAGHDWREKCPLGGADVYLRGKFQRLKKGSWLRRYYKDGWEAMHQLGDHLFCSSSVFWGTPGEEFPQAKCSVCGDPPAALVNQRRVSKNKWAWLARAPVFYCRKHYFEKTTGKPFVEPTEAERKATALTWDMFANPRKYGCKPKYMTCGRCKKRKRYYDWATRFGSCDGCLGAFFKKMVEADQ